MLAEVIRIARKELGGFFASPAAFLFLAAFLLATLFVFFWIETFFARNLADVRPLFKWLPVLLILLVAALSMRMWSEERRAGTLESLLTSPVSTLSLVLGKFFAGLALVGIALLLTLPLPITVSLLGDLDWGPVIGGYVATLFLAAAYLAIGQFMSARTDNPVVALILSATVCAVFYLIGADALTNLFSGEVASVLSVIGTGARFESITRGVIDLRDLYYYLSLVGLFLTLNLFSLERLRWAGNPSNARHRGYALLTVLIAANFVAANFWLAPITWARADITAGQVHSLSPATRDYLAQAKEPLVIRGYFSAQTHPLLAPLVPRMKDLLEEYAIVGGKHVRVEIVNPQESPEKEEEAATKYGIQPVPFQVASKYQAGVVSSYFDVVIVYGDQFEKLGFRDLIEVKAHSEGTVDVALRDPEYAITRAVRKVIGAYQAGGSPFDSLAGDVSFKGYISAPEKLPDVLANLRGDLEAVLAELTQESGGRFKADIVDPSSDGAAAKHIADRFGFRPQVTGPFDPEPFWFYMVLEGKNGAQAVPLPTEPTREALKRSLSAGLQRMAPGVLKTVALVRPQGGDMPSQANYSRLQQTLEENARVVDVDLANGQVPADADLLMVLAPRELNDKQVFAIDQFLMQGGSVVMASSPVEVSITDGIYASEQRSGLEEWFGHMGIAIEDKLVMDPRNAALPIPSMRYIGSVPVREMRMLPYPLFPDVRGDGLNADNPITANLGQLSFNWASPIVVDEAKQGGRQWVKLAASSAQSWQAEGKTVMPDFANHPGSGFAAPTQRQSSTLAVAMEGRFESFFKGKESPLKDPFAAGGDPKDGRASRLIEHSPESARLILISANNFASDAAIEIASNGIGTLYTNPLSFMQNAVDWSLEDRSLLSLRGRTQFARTLEPMSSDDRQFWEALNYGLALAGLVAVWLVRRGLHVVREKRYRLTLQELSA